MKFVYYNTSGTGHHKNYDAIQRMCRVCGIEFEATNSFERCKRGDYDILISVNCYFDPDFIPNVKIIYGPQLFAIPSGDIVGPLNPSYKNRAISNSLSQWIIDYFFEMCNNTFRVELIPLPFAVDTALFAPTEGVEKDLDCLVYIKHRHNSVINYALNTLRGTGIKFETVRYGSYNQDHYKHLLSRSKFMLCLDAHESQGFALQEAMSCGVPLLVWGVKSMHEESSDGYRFVYERYHPKNMLATSVGWWSDECGMKFYEESELEAGIKAMMEKWQTFRPRDFIVRELSERPCVNRILRAFELPEISDAKA